MGKNMGTRKAEKTGATGASPRTPKGKATRKAGTTVAGKAEPNGGTTGGDPRTPHGQSGAAWGGNHNQKGKAKAKAKGPDMARLEADLQTVADGLKGRVKHCMITDHEIAALKNVMAAARQTLGKVH